MRRKFAQLQKVEKGPSAAAQQRQAFLRRVENGLLLALLETGAVSPTQFEAARQALERGTVKSPSEP